MIVCIIAVNKYYECILVIFLIGQAMEQQLHITIYTASLINAWKIPNKDCQIGEIFFSTLLSASG